MVGKKNLSMMELAYIILKENKVSMTFVDLFSAIAEVKDLSDDEKKEFASQVYADFVSSGKFIYIGDDAWDIKGRQAIDLWDKDGAYYDEYPDYEEELSLYEDELLEDEDEEDDSEYEKDYDESDVKDDEEDLADEFEDELTEEEEELYSEFQNEDFDDEDDEEEKEVIEVVKVEDDDDFDDDEYNQYMDDYEEMYED